MPQLLKHTDAVASSGIYFFDVLPYHPQPERLESLTRYLMCVAGANGISSMDGLSALCFQHQDRRITREIADYLSISLVELISVLESTESITQFSTLRHRPIQDDADQQGSALPR